MLFSYILVSYREKPWYNKHAMTLEEKLKNLPDEPGVYMMKDARGHIIYIGKALSLVSRVNSYFQKGPKGEKTELMVRQIADLETIVTHTELEALILESNLIKKHHPRYNIILRDDKNYPYLRFDIKSEYPRLEVVRRLKKTGQRITGPMSLLAACGRHLHSSAGPFRSPRAGRNWEGNRSALASSSRSGGASGRAPERSTRQRIAISFPRYVSFSKARTVTYSIC